jgi:hypothetical protein
MQPAAAARTCQQQQQQQPATQHAYRFMHDRIFKNRTES